MSSADAPPTPRRLVAVVLNYRTPDLTLAAAHSLAPQLDPRRDRLVVVDNASDDGSAARLEAELRDPALADRARLLVSEHNGGFSAGNNLGMASEPAAYYLLLNSDARALPGLVDALLDAAQAHPEAGLLAARLVDEEGSPQPSAFRYPTPLGELALAADIGLVSRCLPGPAAFPAGDEAPEAEWLSFACVLIRSALRERIGGLDPGYFLYYEDVDYCRRAREAGWALRCVPQAVALHGEGGSTGVATARARREPLPAYYYASRARYFSSYYGRAGLYRANLLRSLGYPLAWLRSLVGGRPVEHARGEAFALWRGGLRPPRPPAMRDA